MDPRIHLLSILSIRQFLPLISLLPAITRAVVIIVAFGQSAARLAFFPPPLPRHFQPMRTFNPIEWPVAKLLFCRC